MVAIRKDKMMHKNRCCICPACNNSDFKSYTYNNHLGIIEDPFRYYAKRIVKSTLLKMIEYIPQLYEIERLRRIKTSTVFSGNILRCNNCGFGFLDKNLKDEDLAEYYSFGYWENRVKIQELSLCLESDYANYLKRQFCEIYPISVLSTWLMDKTSCCSAVKHGSLKICFKMFPVTTGVSCWTWDISMLLQIH